MSIPQFIKLVEQVGIPLLTAAVAAYALWYIIRWLLTKFSSDLTRQLSEIAAEIDEEQRDIR